MHLHHPNKYPVAYDPYAASFALNLGWDTTFYSNLAIDYGFILSLSNVNNKLSKALTSFSRYFLAVSK